MPLKEKLKGFLTNKWSWILVAFLLGLDLGWRAHRWMSGERGFLSPFQIKLQSGFDSRDESRDPFEEMRQAQEKMLKSFGGFGGLGGVFGQAQPLEMDSGEFRVREDEKFVYYDLDFNGQVLEDLQVKLEDGQVSISGRLEMNNEGTGGGAVMSSSFHRSFPVPENVIAEKFEIEQNGGKILIKFPKR